MSWWIIFICEWLGVLCSLQYFIQVPYWYISMFCGRCCTCIIWWFSESCSLQKFQYFRWTPTPQVFIFYYFLALQETHIWYILPDEVKSKHLQNHYLNLLSPNEKESVLKIQEGELQKRALLARALVRSTISRCKFSYCYFIFICNVNAWTTEVYRMVELCDMY